MIHMYHFQAWVLQHFPRISRWSCVLTYIEDMTHASAFVSLRGNQATKPYNVYLDCMLVEDIHFHMYVDNRETRTLKDIAFYYGWMTCCSCLTYPNLSERVMRQFDYILFIPRDPYEYAPSIMTESDMDTMFDDYLYHLVPDEALSTITSSDWSVVHDYIQWYFRE